MKKLLAYYINPFTDEHRAVAIDDSLKTFYDMLDCTSVSFTVREVGGNPYTFICDEEGLLNDSDKIRITACTQSDLLLGFETALVGSLLIVSGVDDEGELTSLSDDDVAVIENNLAVLNYKVGRKRICHHCLFLDEPKDEDLDEDDQ